MQNQTLLRGEVYLCKFGKGHGSEQGGTRPVVIVQNDIGNRYSPTTIGIVITSKQKGNFPMHVEVEKGIAGLTEDSTVLGEQIFTLDKTRLIKYLGNIQSDAPHLIDEVNEAIKVSLGI